MPKKPDINGDIKRAQYLAASIFPGDGFVPSDDTNIAACLIELLSIVGKYDNQDDRDGIIFHIGASMYPNAFDGQGAITAWIKRLSNPKTLRRAS